MEDNILDNIKAHLSNGFEKDFFEEAIKNLEVHSRLRLSNFSYAIRELIREVLSRMGPDEKVRSSEWFEPHFEEEPQKITKKQRMTYAIHGGINPDYVLKSLSIDIGAITKDLNDKINRLSKYTHVTEKIFYEDNEKSSNDILKHELSIFSEFLTAIHDCKTRVIEALYDRLSNHVIDEFLSTSITKIDELSTHHYVEDIWINEVYIEEINDTNIDIIGLWINNYISRF